MLVPMTQHSVLATCGADFIGSHLSHCLIESGYEGCGIHVFLRDPIAGLAEVARKDGRATLPFERPPVADSLLLAVAYQQFKPTIPRHFLFPARARRRALRRNRRIHDALLRLDATVVEQSLIRKARRWKKPGNLVK